MDSFDLEMGYFDLDDGPVCLVCVTEIEFGECDCTRAFDALVENSASAE